MKSQKFLLLTLIIMVLMVSTPALAQTTTDVLADGQAEAIQVVSPSLSAIALQIGLMFGGLLGVALWMIYRSSPPIVQKAILDNAQSTIEAYRLHAEKTVNQIDDKIANALATGYQAFLNILSEQEEQDEDETPPDLPTPPSTPVQ